MENYEKRGYLLENFRLFHLSTPGKTQVAFHYHEFHKLLLLRSGRGSYHIDTQHYSLVPGDILLIGSHCVHKPDLEGDPSYERIILYVSPEYLKDLSRGDCDLSALFPGSGGRVLRPGESMRKSLFAQAAELERDMAREGFGRELLSEAGLIRLLITLGRCLEEHREAPAPTPTAPENRRIRDILESLEAHLTENIDIDSLSRQFFISKYHMMRSFRETTGTTIGTYLTHRRLLLARTRMEAGMSATEAAFRSGFHSYSSFTRAWRKFWGTTPTGRGSASLIREEDYE